MVHYGSMTLRDWLRLSKMSVRALADALGESDSITRKWVYGQRQPSLPKALAIQRFTDGAVTAADLVTPCGSIRGAAISSTQD